MDAHAQNGDALVPCAHAGGAGAGRPPPPQPASATTAAPRASARVRASAAPWPGAVTKAAPGGARPRAAPSVASAERTASSWHR